MQFTTQKQQVKEYRHLIQQERMMRFKRAVSILANIVLCGLFAFAPALGTALGWIKD